MTLCLQDSVKKKLIKKEYNAYKNDTKHNHGFSLRPLVKDETDPKWGMEWTAKIFCTDEIFMGSKFVLKISLSSSFPLSAPSLQFMAPIPFHPNIVQGSRGGALCYTLLSSDWSKNSSLTISALITNIAGFLANPNFNDAFRSEPALLYREDRSKYYAKVKELSKAQTQDSKATS